MITVQNLSYSLPDKDLYKKISFSIEEGQHCAFIGSNGTGKTTLVNMLLDPEEYLYDGKISVRENLRYGYVSQFVQRDKNQDLTVTEYLSQDFEKMQAEIMAVCAEMETAEDMEAVFERYQKLLDEQEAVDGDNYESNIKKQLAQAGLSQLAELKVEQLSGGEFKLIQVIKEMLMLPGFLVMDEPDTFLDFENLKGLRDLINSYKGTILVITHNRYLLNNCFDKILHLENCDLQEFEGNYVEYNYSLLLKKIEMQEQSAKDLAEIERQQKLVDKIREEATFIDSATRGRQLKARVSLLERLQARRIKEPFVDVRKPKIVFATPENTVEMQAEGEQENQAEPRTLLKVTDYSLSFDELVLENVSFEIRQGEKVAIVGPNGTGKTTLLREIFKNENPTIKIAEDVKVGFLSQFHSDTLNEEHTVYEEFEVLGFERHADIAAFLEDYYIEPDSLKRKIGTLSGGEKNLIQLAKIAAGQYDLLLLDEPTSHLDVNSQLALEKALEQYQGAILMVSHDFYTIVGSADYVLYVDEKSVRAMRMRTFRKMIYDKHFDKDYLELELKKKELEAKIAQCLVENDVETAKACAEQLSEVVEKM